MYLLDGGDFQREESSSESVRIFPLPDSKQMLLSIVDALWRAATKFTPHTFSLLLKVQIWIHIFGGWQVRNS